VKTRTLVQEEARFADVSALIEEEKAAALAAFDAQAFRTKILSRIEDRRRPVWVRSPRLLAACGLALLLATWALLPPGPGAARRSVDAHVVERALMHAAAWRTAGRVPIVAEPALSDDVWRIERALLTWRRQQGGSVDVERALCLVRGPRRCGARGQAASRAHADRAGERRNDPSSPGGSTTDVRRKEKRI
jgi:hypothetical protein